MLSAVKDDLATEQGQLLLRVLKLLTTVNKKAATQEKEAPAPADGTSGG